MNQRIVAFQRYTINDPSIPPISPQYPPNIPQSKPKRPRAEAEREIMENIPNEVRAMANQYVSERDFLLFVCKKTLTHVAGSFRDYSGLKTKMSHLRVLVKFAAKSNCKLWRAKLRPKKSMTDADGEYWDKLKIAVEKQRQYLAMPSVNNEMAERIIRLKISTNMKLIEGLPLRLKVWK